MVMYAVDSRCVGGLFPTLKGFFWHYRCFTSCSGVGPRNGTGIFGGCCAGIEKYDDFLNGYWQLGTDILFLLSAGVYCHFAFAAPLQRCQMIPIRE